MYFNYTAASSNDGVLGNWQGRRHLDCNFPWFLPTEKSPTKWLEKLPKTVKGWPLAAFTTVFETTKTAGKTIWELPKESHLSDLISQLPEDKQLLTHDEMVLGFQTLAAAYLSSAGDGRKMREVGKAVRILQSVGLQRPTNE